MFNKMKLKTNNDILEAPYIKIETTVIQPGVTNSKPNIKRQNKYVIAPSGKKISTYITNQIFGSDLVTQTEGLDINWLMPTLKNALTQAVYDTESFIYINSFDNKIYLETINKNEIHDLVQKYDKIISCTIIQEIEGQETNYELHRHIEIDNGVTYLTFKAFEIDRNNELVQIDLNTFNFRTGNDYLPNYVLPYEILINIDIGEEFFKDSKKFLNEEMIIFNTIADELEKTKTRIATSQHYQTGDLVSNWTPQSNHYKVESLSVGKLQDYFTLLPGDKEHQIFQFLQGNIRIDEYIKAFKFCDYQVIQMSGLSPASFGYEKDAYQNESSVDLSKNNSDMTVEAIKTQIEPQINKLLLNVVKAQQSNNITENLLPFEINWDYGLNEKFDDIKKINVLNRVQSVSSVPYSIKAKIVMPILKKLIDNDYVNNNIQEIEELIKANDEENKKINIEFGEI